MYSEHAFVYDLFFSILCPIVITFLTGVVFGKHFINFLVNKLNITGQPIRTYGPLTHLSKKNIPNMGGFIVFLPVYITWIAMCDLKKTWVFLLSLLIFNALGFIDDYLKITRKSPKGINAKMKLVGQFTSATLFVSHYYGRGIISHNVLIPFYGYLNIGILCCALAILTIISSSNAVNLTDGLDGLVTPQLILNAFFILFVLLIIPHNTTFHFISGVIPSLKIITSAFIGGCLAFLWYNAYPARIFMGDNGSLAAGAFLGCLVSFLGIEFLLIISGLLFVIETLSVILQIIYIRKTKGRKLFLMAPIHHHFEQLNIHETTITTRMSIFTLICVIFAITLFNVSMVHAA